MSPCHLGLLLLHAGWSVLGRLPHRWHGLASSKMAFIASRYSSIASLASDSPAAENSPSDKYLCSL